MFIFIRAWTSCFRSLFWYNGGKPDSNSFTSLNRKNKNSTWWANSSAAKSLFDTWYRRICLTLRHCIVSPAIINLIFGGVRTWLFSWSFLTRLSSNSSSWYSQVLLDLFLCNMLKILLNKNCLKHCIFHCRMLHLAFPYSNQYLISCKYLGCRLSVR